MLNIFLLAAETTHKPNGNVLPNDLNEVYWGTIAFLIVLGLLIWKGLPAAKNMARTRRERLAKELDDAAAERVAAETALTELQQRIANADEECARIVAEADEAAVSLKEQLVAKADADAADVRRRAAEDATSSQGQVSRGLELEVGRLAIGAAEAVIANSLDAEAQSDLIEKYIAKVGSGS
jgi:F-type H+-transporting ATPase subunit b